MHPIARRRFRASLRPKRQSMMTILLARYLAGQIADQQWSAISSTLDASDANGSERDAYAAFLLDATATSDEVVLPNVDEASDLIAVARL